MCSEKTARCNQESAYATTRVLLADDDLASSRFLGDGLRQMGVHVHTCHHGLQALEVARTERFDLLLLDCRMPGAGAVEILAELRCDPAAACCASTAVASSAEDESDEHRRTLLAAGFVGILRKPCTLAQVQQILTLIPAAGDAASMLDDDSGLSTSGDYATLRALRMLLLEELVNLDRQLDALARNPLALSERLHRLRAACGFCGADELANAAAALQVGSGRAGADNAEWSHFRAALHATLRALTQTAD